MRTIFEMVAAGSTYMQIAQHLNSCGYLIPSEYKKQHGYKVNGMYDRHMKIGKWTRDMVRTFISNEVYIGTVVNHKSTVLNFRTKKKGNVPKSEHIKIPNMHEPIIDINLWNTVQKLRQTRSKASSGKDGKNTLFPAKSIVKNAVQKCINANRAVFHISDVIVRRQPVNVTIINAYVLICLKKLSLTKLMKLFHSTSIKMN